MIIDEDLDLFLKISFSQNTIKPQTISSKDFFIFKSIINFSNFYQLKKLFKCKCRNELKRYN